MVVLSDLAQLSLLALYLGIELFFLLIKVCRTQFKFLVLSFGLFKLLLKRFYHVILFLVCLFLLDQRSL